MARANFPYPPSPADVPDDLTDYSPEYSSRQWTLVTCLMIFLMLYAVLVLASGAMTFGFLLLVGKLHVFALIGALLSGVVFVFLVKGLFKRQRVEKELHIELTEEEQPKLFAFIRQLCDEVGVEEPRKVFVSPEVNAAVMYRTSLVNIVVQPKKDLLIGLGLVNCLTLSEFKAAMAHEFGHFSQGGWVNGYFHVVYRICYDIVVGRDWFDQLIDGLKKAGGWGSAIGYTAGGVVGAFRWTLDKTFGLLAFQRHSVLREQEFHADLVAVSLAGSNAITHCLYRLGFASETFGQAFDDLCKAADHKLYTADIFYHQHAAADLLRKRKKDPTLGKPPVLRTPLEGRKVQVFDPEKDDDPAEQGDYHPANFDREENIKDRFVAADEDTRSAWVLFDDPAELRERVTYKIYRMKLRIPKGSELADPKEVQRFIDDEHAETTYDEKYAGVYDGRLIDPGDLDELNDLIRSEPWDNKRLATVYAKLYADLRGRADEWKETSDELDRVYGESGGAKSKRVRRIIKELEEKLEEQNDWFSSLDRRVYLVFVQMAYRVNENYYYDLIGRYRFHMAMQGIFKTVRDQQRKAHFFVSVGLSQEQVSPDLFAEISHVLRDARKALRNILRDADDINMPAMKNFVAGDRLGDFLLDEELVRELPEHVIQAKWINKLMRQLDGVRTKAQRLHFKSLGGLLALQEKIAVEFLAQHAAPPAAAG
jgi:Zn-dependent protease with chaperone function